MKRRCFRSTVAISLSLVLALSQAMFFNVFAEGDISADSSVTEQTEPSGQDQTGTDAEEPAPAADRNAKDADEASTKASEKQDRAEKNDKGVDEKKTTQKTDESIAEAGLSHRTIRATGDEKGNEYDISVTGNLPADAQLQVVMLPQTEAHEIVDSVPADVNSAIKEKDIHELADKLADKGMIKKSSVDKLVEKTLNEISQNKSDPKAKDQAKKNGRIISGQLGGEVISFSCDISIISGGKRFQPADYGEEVIVTVRNADAGEIYHVKKDVADENGNVDEKELAGVSRQVSKGSIETEKIAFVNSGRDLSFAMDTFSITTGTIGSNVTWELDTETGALTIRPTTEGSTGRLPNVYQIYDVDQTTAVKNAWGYLNYSDSIKSVIIKSGVRTDNEIRHMFNGCTELKTVDLSGLDMTSCTSINDMFRNCSKLESVDFGAVGVKPSSLMQMNRLFKNCTSLKSINFDGFNFGPLWSNAANRTGADYYLVGANNVETISMKNTTQNSYTTAGFFKSHENLTKVDMSGSTFNSNVTTSSISGMFNGSGIKELVLSGVTFANTSLDISGIFTGATGIERLDLSGTTIGSSMGLDISSLNALSDLNASGADIALAAGFPDTGVQEWDYVSGTSAQRGLTSVDINTMISNAGGKLPAGIYRHSIGEGLIAAGNIDGQVRWELAEDGTLTLKPYTGTSGILSMDADDWESFGKAADPQHKSSSTKFNSASDWPWNSYRGLIRNVAIQGTISTGTQKDFNGMFQNCTNLTSVDLSGWDASNVNSLNDMFANTAITSFDFASFGTKPTELKQINRMFQNSTGLKTVSFDGLDMSAMTQVNNVFNGSGIETIDASETSLNQLAANKLFAGYTTLRNIDLTNASLDSSATDIKAMLSDTPALENLNITGFSNPAAAQLRFDNLPIGVRITSDGTTYVVSPNTGEWTIKTGTTTVSGKMASDLRNEYIDTEGKLKSGEYTKIGEGILSIYGEMGDIVWEIVDNGVLKIYPKNGTSGTLVCPTSAGTTETAQLEVWPWNEYRSMVRSIEMNQGTVLTNDDAMLRRMFQGMTSLTSVDLSDFDVTKVKYMNNMFTGCTALQDISLNFKNGSSASVIQINNMFNGCSSLRTLDFCDLGTAASGFSYIDFLRDCTRLEEIDISNVNFGDGATVDLSACGNLKRIIMQPANNGKALNIILPGDKDSSGNSLGTWKLGDKKYSGTANLPANTSGILEKTSDYPPGLDEVPSTYYVIDRLDAYTIQVWDETLGGYREIRNWHTENGEVVVSSGDLPSNDEEWMDTDTGTSYHIRNEDGHIEIYTRSQSGADWKSGAESGSTATTNAMGEKGYVYDRYPNYPDIIITYKDAAMDVNGNRHDAVMNIDKFTFYNTDNGNLVNMSTYRRSILGIGEMKERSKQTGEILNTYNRVTYRDYILQPKDETDVILRASNGTTVTIPSWRKGTDQNGTGNMGGGTYASGTWTDSALKIADGTANQTVLFFVGDLDVARNNSREYGPGSEGIILGNGFDTDTISIADNTLLETYDYDAGTHSYVKHTGDGYGTYMVGTASDPDTYRSRFYVAAKADGAAFTWTSGLNCDTNMLETTAATDIWRGLPPVTIQPSAMKTLVGDTLKADQFDFVIEPDTSISLENGNLAMDPHAPFSQGEHATMDAQGNIRFPEMSFEMSSDRTYSPIGTHHYILKEIPGSDSDIEYDRREHKLRIVIEGVDTEVAAGTIGYTLKAYIDNGSEPIITTYSSMPVTYGNAKKASTGATSAEFLNKTYTWIDTSVNPEVTYTYSYDRSKGVWKRNDGVEEDPPAEARAEYDVSYSQAVTMAAANPEGSIQNSTIRSTVWSDDENRYEYRTQYGPIELDYSGVDQSGKTDEEIKAETWTDNSVTPAVSYKWESVPTRTRYSEYTGNKTGRTWLDDAGNTYRHEQIKAPMQLGDAEAVHGRDTSAIRQVEWEDSATGKKYSYGLRTNYKNDPYKDSHLSYSIPSNDGHSRTYSSTSSLSLTQAINNYTSSQTAEELFDSLGDAHFYTKQRIDATGTPSVDYDEASVEPTYWPNASQLTASNTSYMRNAFQTNKSYQDGDLGSVVRWTDIERGEFEIVYFIGSYGSPALVRSEFPSNVTVDVDNSEFYYINSDRSATSESEHRGIRSSWTKFNTGRVTVDSNNTLFAGFYSGGASWANSTYSAALIVPATFEGFTEGFEKVVGTTTGVYGYSGWNSIATGDPVRDWSGLTRSSTWHWSNGSGNKSPHKLARLAADGVYRNVYYAPYKVNGEYQYDAGGNLLFEQYYYQNNTSSYYRTPQEAIAAGDTKVSMGTVTLEEIGQISGSAPHISYPYIYTHSVDGIVQDTSLVIEPPDEAVRTIKYNAWGSYEDLPGNAVETAYNEIPKTAVGMIMTGSYAWNRYDDQGTYREEVSEPPADAYFINGYHYSWVKYVGDSTSGEEVESPSPRSKPSTPYTVTYSNVWLQKNKNTNEYEALAPNPSPESTAKFTLTYRESAYAVSNAVSNDYIRSLEWKDGNDSYKYNKLLNTWFKNNLPTSDEPPDNAEAVFWNEPAYSSAPTGVTFNNRKTTSLTVTKDVQGEGNIGNRQFDFTVTFPTLNNENVLISRNGVDSTITLDDEGAYSFKLMDGESVTFMQLVSGVGYNIKENPDSDFATSASLVGDTAGIVNNASTTGIVVDTSLTASTTVTYTNRIKQGDLTVKKNTVGNKAGSFDFRIRFTDGYTPTSDKLTRIGTGNVYKFTLANGTQLDLASLPPGLEYEIWEELPAGSNWKLESVDHVKDATIASGEIKAGGSETHTFLNRESDGSLEITKAVTGNVGDKTKQFSFTLTAASLAGETYKDVDDNDVVFDSNGETTFKLRDGENIVILGIPSGTAYSVSEDDYSSAGYTTTVDSSAGRTVSGTLTANGDIKHKYENDKSATTPTGINGLVSKYWYWMLLAALVMLAVWFVISRRHRRSGRQPM